MVLTQAEKKRRARERYLNSKAYAKKMQKREEKQKDIAWSLKIRERPCFVCGTWENLHAHHLLPREFRQERHNLLNGVSLCCSHHKFNLNISAHRAPSMFMILLEKESPEQFVWLQNRLQLFLDKERK